MAPTKSGRPESNIPEAITNICKAGLKANNATAEKRNMALKDNNAALKI